MFNKLLKKFAAGILASAVIVSSTSSDWTGERAEAAGNTMLNLNGVYHAALGIQTATEKWFHRWGYYGAANNPEYGTENAGRLCSGTDVAEGTFNDVEIAGNGTYTVSLTDADFQGEKTISQLHVATDIPGKNNNPKISFSDVSVTVNDKEVLAFKTPFLEPEKYNADGMVILLANHWRSGLKPVLQEAGYAEDGENGFNFLNGEGKETISVSFTVSGFNYNKGGTPSSAEDWFDIEPAPEKGSIHEVSGYKYIITNPDKENGEAVLSASKENVVKASVPSSVAIEGYTYKVSGIGPSAFAGNKKLTNISVGNNVVSIGEKAFNGCSKLKMIDLSKNTVLQSVGKNAVKGVSSKCVVKVPKSKKSAYKKIFAGKGRKVTIK